MREKEGLSYSTFTSFNASAFDEAARLRDAGEFSEALARAEHALALREAALGGTHPDVAIDGTGAPIRTRSTRSSLARSVVALTVWLRATKVRRVSSVMIRST